MYSNHRQAVPIGDENILVHSHITRPPGIDSKTRKQYTNSTNLSIYTAHIITIIKIIIQCNYSVIDNIIPLCQLNFVFIQYTIIIQKRQSIININQS